MKPTTALKGWATDATYTTGPKAGLPTKQTIPDGVAAEGHRPGKTAPTAAEHWNYWLNTAWLWIDWLRQGSALGEATAHVCETDANGQLQLEQLLVSPASAASYGGRFVGHPNAGMALQVTSGNAFGDPSLYAESTGAGVAFEAYCNGTGSSAWIHNNNAGVPALLVEGNLALRCVSVGSQPAAAFQGSATSTYAASFATTNPTGYTARFVGAANAPAAAVAEAGATSDGFVAFGGSTSGHGLKGVATAISGYGVWGESAATGGAAGGGVRGRGLASAPGGYFTGVDGPGAEANSTGGRRAALALTPTANDPALTIKGDLCVNSTDGLYKIVMASTWVGLQWRRLGSAGEVVAGSNSSTTNDAGNPVIIATRALIDYQAPRAVGKVKIEVTAGIGRTGTCGIGFDLVDLTDGVIFKSFSLALFQSGAGVYERETKLACLYPLPAAGDRTFRVEMYRVGGGAGDTVRCRDVVMTVDGVWE